MPPALDATSRRGSRRARLVGIDVARALAFGGMLLAHYAFPPPGQDRGWLGRLDASADGRAAPLFCVVLGVGAGLLVRSGSRDRTFVLRGLALFVLGLAIWPYQETVYLILPHYGLLLATVPLWRRVPTGWLLPLAVAAFLAPSTVVALWGPQGLRLDVQPDSYDDLRDAGRVARNLLWTGGYPLVGWVGFLLVGLWLARQRLADRFVQLSLLFGGVLVMLAQPLFATALADLSPATAEGGGSGAAAFLDGTAHSNRTAWYVLASATAVAVLAACLLATSAAATSRLARPLVHLGQLALTAYLVHLVVGEEVVWDWQRDTRPSLAAQVLVAAAVYVALAALASLWRARFRRGPVESLLRAVSG